MNPKYPQVAVRASRRCEYCRAPESIFNFRFEVEHIHPRSQGGSDEIGNLALACSACNLYKGEATTGWDEMTRGHVLLFHPRHDRWDEHFAFDIGTAEIQGVTAVGRATVARLQMNQPQQKEARLLWLRLNLYL